MNLFAIYDTRTGTTPLALHMLERELPRHTMTVQDLRDGSPAPEALERYDAILVGGPIRYGKLSGHLRMYLERNEQVLLARPLGLFYLCGFADRTEAYEELFPDTLRHHAFAIACFGGELNPARARGLDKVMMKAVRSQALTGGENGWGAEGIALPSLSDGAIAQFADRIKAVVPQSGIDKNGELW